MENPIVALSRIVSATRINHRMARDLYDRNLPDLMVLYLQGTDEIGHVFAPYVPPRLDCTTEADFARYRGHDGRLLRARRPGPRPVDAPRERGRRDPHRALRPRLQVGGRPHVRALVGELGDGGLLAPDQRRVRCVGRARPALEEPHEGDPLRRRPDGARAVRAAGRPPHDREGRHRRFPGTLRSAEGGSLLADDGPPRRGPGGDRGGGDGVREEAPRARLPDGGRERSGGARRRRPSGNDRGRLEQPRRLPSGDEAEPGGRRSSAAEVARAPAGLQLADVQPRRSSTACAERTRRRATGSSARSPRVTRSRSGRSRPGSWSTRRRTSSPPAGALLEEATKSFPANEPFARELALIQFRAPEVR